MDDLLGNLTSNMPTKEKPKSMAEMMAERKVAIQSKLEEDIKNGIVKDEPKEKEKKKKDKPEKVEKPPKEPKEPKE